MKPRAFTLIELLVVISIIALLVGILLPALGMARQAARQMTNSTQTRGIHQGMVAFAQSNKGWYPGIVGSQARSGSDDAFVDTADIATYSGVGATTDAGAHVGARFALMLEEGLFSPEYLVSPAENPDAFPAPITFSTWEPTGSYGYNKVFHSYAIPHIAEPGSSPSGRVPGGARFREWNATLNAAGVAISDRVMFLAGAAATGGQPNGNPDQHRSLWSKDGQGGGWGGSITWNDGHTAYNDSSVLDNTTLDGISHSTDNIFHRETNAESGAPGAPGEGQDNNTHMIHRGWINSY